MIIKFNGMGKADYETRVMGLPRDELVREELAELRELYWGVILTLDNQIGQ